MRPIAEVAKQKLCDVPEFHALTMPPANAMSAQLMAGASAMADAAQSHEQVFTDVGLPDDFVMDLRSTADDVANSARVGCRAVRGVTNTSNETGQNRQEFCGRISTKEQPAQAADEGSGEMARCEVTGCVPQAVAPVPHANSPGP
jgi:hypothetical protein